ncbi:MAG: zf-HC2 domain-containing protein [Verrucomicrobia bacterium]|nr:zf-HC2 domain-containing protein [Verrucomicrobiota bacterium]
MNCIQCQAEFDRLLDGRLDSQTETLLRKHLEDCPDCGAAWRDYEGAWAAFVSVTEIEPSSNFVARVMGQLDRVERETPAHPWFFPLPWRWVAPATAAVMLFAASIGVWMNVQHDADQAVNQELAVNLPVVQHLDLLRDFDIIANLDRIAPFSDHDPIEEMLKALWNS